MGDVDEVVDLGARPDHRIVHAAPVDAGVRANLDVVPDQAAPHVRDLAMRLAALAGDVPEPITADHRTRMYDDALPERRARVQTDAGIELRVVADRHAVAEDAPGANADVATQLHAGAQHRMRADLDRLLPRRAATHDRARMHARFPHGLRVQHRQHHEQRAIRVGDDDAGLRSSAARRLLQIGRDEDDGRAGALKVWDVPGRGKKRQIAGTRALQRRNAGDRRCPRPHQPSAGERRDFTCGERPRSRRIHGGKLAVDYCACERRCSTRAVMLSAGSAAAINPPAASASRISE